MKKYVSSEFVATKYGIYKAAQDVITSFPSTIIANGGNVAPWAIYGNEDSGDYVGEKTLNLFDFTTITIGKYINASGEESISAGTGEESLSHSDYIEISPNTDYTFYKEKQYGVNATDNAFCWFDENKNLISRDLWTASVNATDIQHTSLSPNGAKYVIINFRGLSYNTSILVSGSSTPSTYIPYGYDVSIIVNNFDTYHCYISDVLRKSSGETPVYDTMSSDGTIIRRVDTDGTPLVTPTTESFTPPTIATAAGNNSINFGTTVKPSKFELTYTGWHMYDDKKYSGGEWG